MHKLIVLYPHPDDPDAFEEYYRAIHLPLTAELPGALGLRFSLHVDAAQGESPYFAIFEADFADGDALAAALSSPQGRAVQADVPNYASGGAVALHYSVEVY